MYCAPTLGRFYGTPPGQWEADPEHAILDIKYQAETPVQVRGALNPWELERTRELFLAEEAAWKTIQKDQVRYRELLRLTQEGIVRFNGLVAQLESLTGKKSGLLSVNNIASFVASSSGNPYVMAAMAVKMVVEAILGSQKKKKIDRIMQELQSLQAQILAWYAELTTIQERVSELVQTGDRIRTMQQARFETVVAQSESAYQTRQNLDAQRGAVLRERNRQVALLYPTRPGGSDAV